MIIADIIKAIEDFAPLYLQEDYDNAGLQVGNTRNEATGAMLCVDITEAILDETIAKGCNLIISHHPLLFKGLKSISGKNEIERIVLKAIKNDVALYSAHTNIDNAWGGVSHIMASKLGLTAIEVLQPQQGSLIKIATFVPQSHCDSVQAALFAAGAGEIGNYDSCSYCVNGTGSFRAKAGANPFVGTLNELHNEDEVKIEVIAPMAKKSAIIKALIDAHPYEEPAFDIIQLANDSRYCGSGVIGNIMPENKVKFLERLKNIFGVGAVKYSSAQINDVSKVALCGGSGAFLIKKAIDAGADIYVTGDVKYHDFTTFGTSIIIADIGHYESEQFTKEIFYNIIQKKIPNFATYYPDKEKNPINYL
ncbi:MAG: Nif3-like dinuclear metal center hexameric protein [Muribaculaceae bacterium]